MTIGGGERGQRLEFEVLYADAGSVGHAQRRPRTLSLLIRERESPTRARTVPMAVVIAEMGIRRWAAVPRFVVLFDDDSPRRSEYIAGGSIDSLCSGRWRCLLEGLDHAVADPLIP